MNAILFLLVSVTLITLLFSSAKLWIKSNQTLSEKEVIKNQRLVHYGILLSLALGLLLFFI